MKKFLFLILSIGYWITIIAAEPASSWVESIEGKIIAKKITIGDASAKLILENGDKRTIALDQINTYSVEGKVYKKLPLYLDGEHTGQFVFMELVKTKDQYNLYRYSYWSYNPYIKVTCFLQYCGDELVMEYDETSHP
jgi:hypothetical protein